MADNILDQNNPSGPVQVKNMKVRVDRQLCIGAATCVAVAPKTFVLDADSKAVILETAVNEDDNTIIEAARACPVAAISIEDEKGEKIFPR